jgi:Amt family ammonium transporter
MSPAPAIDVPSLLDRCMGNLTFLEKMLTKFQEQSAATLTQLTTSLASRDPESTARAAHALKGAAANLSAPRVTEIAAQLEHLARAAQLDSADTALAALKSEMHRCLADIPAAITRAKSLTPRPEP